MKNEKISKMIEQMASAKVGREETEGMDSEKARHTSERMVVQLMGMAKALDALGFGDYLELFETLHDEYALKVVERRES